MCAILQLVSAPLITVLYQPNMDAMTSGVSPTGSQTLKKES